MEDPTGLAPPLSTAIVAPAPLGLYWLDGWGYARLDERGAHLSRSPGGHLSLERGNLAMAIIIAINIDFILTIN